ncbi:MAG TPA: FAD-dependent oxidoreductase [Acidimicrobiales bacterium]|nr:FAD-dependent oxidoreductase [Acidimicrobiales bacterium]
MSLAPDSAVVVVGAGLAGLRAAENLRAGGHRGPLTLVGEEPHPPYDRPPLSKQFLAGTWGIDRVVLRDPPKLEALGADFVLGRRAVSLDVEGRSLALDDGRIIGFDGLVLATGSHPRTLAGTEAVAGVHVLRTLDDCLALAGDVEDTRCRLVVIGAGFIGSEVAATCRGRGLEVTVLEALPVPLERVLGEQMGEACAALHRSHGVELRTAVAVAGVRTDAHGTVSGVELADGTVVPADVVLVGIGVTPTTDWLEGSGLELRDGVLADATLHAAEHVVVAGDLARWFDEDLGDHRRVEHWENAANQGMHAANSLLAGRRDAEAYRPVPYFWSDQYEIKIQMLGIPSPDDELSVVDGAVSDGRFVAVYGRRGRLTAALGFGRPRQLMAFRSLLERHVSFDEARSALSA